jgi:hypothetical protein
MVNRPVPVGVSVLAVVGLHEEAKVVAQPESSSDKISRLLIAT